MERMGLRPLRCLMSAQQPCLPWLMPRPRSCLVPLLPRPLRGSLAIEHYSRSRRPIIDPLFCHHLRPDNRRVDCYLPGNRFPPSPSILDCPTPSRRWAVPHSSLLRRGRTFSVLRYLATWLARTRLVGTSLRLRLRDIALHTRSGGGW